MPGPDPGHPVELSAVSSLRKWTFEPYVIGGKAMPVLGVLDIPFDFGGNAGLDGPKQPKSPSQLSSTTRNR
jgi:hypothetical protein